MAVWVPKKINNVNGQGERSEYSEYPSNRNEKIQPTGRMPFKKAKKKPDPPTITVLLVDQTPGGELAKRLQKVEDRLAGITGYRVRVTETAGSQLCRVLPNTNPWKGMDCGREDCYPCSQGGENFRTVRRETYYTKAAVRFATLKKREETGKVRNCLEPL